ncbi:MAG: hypothetical protein AAFX78_00920 [Cyanobacteria bacterium J06638_20]
MKSYDLYAELELITPEAKREAQQALRAAKSPLKKIWQFAQGLQTHLTNASEPRITQQWDSQGNSYYEVYDPISRQRLHCNSELEVRAWLEQRYYNG